MPVSLSVLGVVCVCGAAVVVQGVSICGLRPIHSADLCQRKVGDLWDSLLASREQNHQELSIPPGRVQTSRFGLGFVNTPALEANHVDEVLARFSGLPVVPDLRLTPIPPLSPCALGS